MAQQDEKEESSLIPLKTSGEFESSDELFGEVPQVSLTWENICYDTSKKNILSDISGYLPSGKILAIIGPSGAGKTTLLQILSGCMIATSGNLYYNGKIKQNTCDDGFNSDIMGYNGNAAFITQELSLHGSLTVRETLYYASQLKCHNIKNKKELNDRVDKLLEYLGLTHCQHTIIGNVFVKGISGGEKKRVSVGCELVTQTSLLFLDEPTSGLDATATNTLLFMLHKLTLLGHSIIITIHQPSSGIFDLLSLWQDYLMILEHGKLMYFGLCNQSISFFDQIGYKVPKYTNPFEYFLNAVNSDFINFNNTHKIEPNPKYINEHFEKVLLPTIKENIVKINENFLASNIPTYTNKPNGFVTQLSVLLKRNFVSSSRNPLLYIIRALLISGLALGMGLFNFGLGTKDRDIRDRVLILFVVSTYFCFLGIAAIPVFAEERAIFTRERMNRHYHTLAYSISHLIARQPFILAMSFVAVLCLVLLLEIDTNLTLEFYILFSVTIYAALTVSESLMVMLSGLAKNSAISLVIGSALHGLFIVTNGFIRPHHLPLLFKIIRFISPYTYSFEILMELEFRDIDFDDNNVQYQRSEDVMQRYNMSSVDIGINFIVLAGILVIYECIFSVALKFLNRVTY